MSKEDNLVDISKRPDFKEITAKGGRVKSEAKHRAAKLRGIQFMSDKNIEKRSLELVRDPEASAIQIIELIKELLERDLQPRTKVELLGKMVQAHTAIHGVKTKNVNLNIAMNSDTIIERLKNWKRNKNVPVNVPVIEVIGEAIEEDGR